MNGALVAIEAYRTPTSYMDIIASSEEPAYKPSVVARLFTKHLPPLLSEDRSRRNTSVSISDSHILLPKQLCNILQVKQGNRVVVMRRKPETIEVNAVFLRWCRQVRERERERLSPGSLFRSCLDIE